MAALLYCKIVLCIFVTFCFGGLAITAIPNSYVAIPLAVKVYLRFGKILLVKNCGTIDYHPAEQSGSEYFHMEATYDSLRL